MGKWDKAAESDHYVSILHLATLLPCNLFLSAYQSYQRLKKLHFKKEINHMTYNPYDYQFPVDAAEMFFGRRALLDEFIRNFTNIKPRSYYLVGGRRMGKTSLLQALTRELSTSSPNSPAPYALPLYLDMQYEAIDTRRDFFICILRLLHEAIHAMNWEGTNILAQIAVIPLLTQDVGDGALLRRFEQIFSAIRQAVRPHIGSLQVVLLVDESERLLGKQWAYMLLDNLRALLSNRPATRGSLSMIMAGASDFYHEISGEGSPLRNILRKKLLFGLNIEDALSLVAKPTQGQLFIDATNEVLTQTGGHPFLTQYIMHHLWEKHTLSDVDVKLVQATACTIWDIPETLEDWCTDIGLVGEAAYALIHPQEGWIERSLLFAWLTEYEGKLRPALEALTYHGLVHHNPRRGYQMAGTLFRDWFMAFRATTTPSF